MKPRLDHVNLTVSNLEESIQWYCSLFGFEKVESGVYPQGHRWAILAYNDSMIAMTEYPEKRPSNLERVSAFQGIKHFGIRISDREAWLERITQFHLQIRSEDISEYQGSISWYVYDPSGHNIEVSWSNGLPLQF
jgi:catechol 2,3-dioxygenase-like lactoylglutathione lyase family enzyme